VNTAREDANGTDVDLQTVLAVLWLRRWWIVASIVASTAVFAAVAFWMTPIYRATIVMVPASNEQNAAGSALGQLGGIAALAGINLGSTGSAVEESLAVLRSRSFTENFIRDQQLMPELFPKRRIGTISRWFGRSEDPALAEGYRYFDERIRLVAQDRRTGLVSVHIDWTDPDKAALWANELVARLNAELRRRAIEDSAASVEYLQKELLARTVIDTRQAIARLMETQINKGMFANVTLEYAFRVIDKALPPDSKDPIRPKKALMLALGCALGLFLGCMLALVVPRSQRSGRRVSPGME
jgi:uncharacterized protein involved in exopolysaccharide biosynthesis